MLCKLFMVREHVVYLNLLINSNLVYKMSAFHVIGDVAQW
jgi:hypothetical protein